MLAPLLSSTRFLLVLAVTLSALPVRADQAPVEVVSVATARQVIETYPGAVVLSVSPNDPDCQFCTGLNTDLPARLTAHQFQGKALRLDWAKWAAIPADVKTLVGTDLGGVPVVYYYLNGQQLDSVMGLQRTQIDAMLDRHAAAAAAAKAAAGPTAAAAGGTTKAGAGSPAPGTSLALNPASLRAYYGSLSSLLLTAKDARGKATTPPGGATWTSSDTKVATVDAGGRVQLLRRGKVTITVTAGGLSASSQVEVLGFSHLARTTSRHECAISDDRTQPFCWGQNLWSIPLDRPGVTLAVSAPTAIQRGELPADARIADLTASDFVACLLTEDGRVFCWGNSQQRSALGRERTAPLANQALPPAEIAGGELPAGTRFQAVGVGPQTACAAGRDHQLYCWGTASSLPQAGPHRRSDWVAAPMRVASGEIPAGTDIQAIAPSTNGGCVLAGGEVYCWNGNSQLPARVLPGEHAGGDAFVHLESDDFSCALTASGRAYCRGVAKSSRFGLGVGPQIQSKDWKAVPDSGAGGFKVLAEGKVACASCALDPQGRPWCWGLSHLGSAGDGNMAEHEVGAPKLAIRGEVLDDVKLVDLRCGEYTCYGLGDDGRIYNWGSNEAGALARGETNPGGSARPLVSAGPALR